MSRSCLEIGASSACVQSGCGPDSDLSTPEVLLVVGAKCANTYAARNCTGARKAVLSGAPRQHAGAQSHSDSFLEVPRLGTEPCRHRCNSFQVIAEAIRLPSQPEVRFCVLPTCLARAPPHWAQPHSDQRGRCM